MAHQQDFEQAQRAKGDVNWSSFMEAVNAKAKAGMPLAQQTHTGVLGACNPKTGEYKLLRLKSALSGAWEKCPLVPF